MTILTGLTHDGNTRIGAEALIYYNLGRAEMVGTLIVTGDAGEYDVIPHQNCAGEDLEYPASGFTVAVLPKSNKAAITMTPGSNIFPANSPVGTAVEISDSAITDINSISLAGGQKGDTVDIFVLPPRSQDTIICFDQGFNAAIGRADRPIPRKFNAADHFVRQRPENTLSISALKQTHWVGINRINGIDVTLIAKIFPNGGSAPSEIQYYLKSRLSVPPLNSPAEANDSIQLDAEGVFDRVAIFAALPE